MPAMKNEPEIIAKIIEAARQDDSVRGVIRTDLLPKRKYLYTYNFCFIVNDIEKFDEDVFQSCFGERILLFRGDRNYPEIFPGTKAHLMVFRDGVTIVIHAMDANTFLARYDGKSTHANVWTGDTYQKLLDKDNILPEIERLEEKQTIFASAPSQEEFNNINSEFWWVMKTFAEYTLREELLPSMFYLSNSVRDLLNRMIRWYICLKVGKPVNMGILDSRMEEILDADLFCLYKKTYPNADYSQIWEAYESVAELWRKTGLFISEHCGFEYPNKTDRDMTQFIHCLKEQKQTGMDNFVDERDFSLLEHDRYTFFVLRRIIGGSCHTLLSNHENLIICYTGEPYPVWIWTADGASAEIVEKAYRLASEKGFVNNGQRFNMKYDLAEYMIRRSAEDGRELSVSTNMFAYDCPEPVTPSVKADGEIHRCTAEDLDELAEFLDVFHQEIGIDRKDAAGYRVDAQAFIDSGNMFLWKNAQGISVASCKYAPNGMMASINLVFTRKAYRRKHYAENLVYQVTTIVKEAGFIPMLYTDADYPASNACYEKIGYVLRGRLCTVTVKG